jgi:SAM-dependent methyltransferase
MRRNYRSNNRETLALEMDYYDHIQGPYEPLADSDYELILSQLPSFAQPPAVLEVGYGSGAFGARLRRRLASTINVGLDVSFNLLSRHPSSAVLGDGQALPFQHESFDLIAASASLHHIHSLRKTLSEIFRCLAPGGRVIFVEPNADHPYRRLVVDGGFLRKYFLQTSDESIFPEDLVQLMQSIGFCKLQYRYVTFRNRRTTILGYTQFLISRCPIPSRMERYIHPWFVFTGEK